MVVVAEAAPASLPLLALPLFLLWWTAKESLAREHAAETDPLTGVTNRGRLAEVVTARIGSDRSPTAVCLLDLDRSLIADLRTGRHWERTVVRG